MTENYFDITRLIERLHRQFLDVLRSELRRMGIEDINAVQALLLYNIGDDDVVIRDLKDRGYYHGSNVSYNIKSLTELGYLTQERSAHDRRSVRLHLTEKGTSLVASIRAMQAHLAGKMTETDELKADLDSSARTLQNLERVWTDFIRYGQS